MLPALFVIWLYWPAHDGELLADELLLQGYVTDVEAGNATRWHRVADDLAGPWAFGNGTYYRPLVTLSMAIDHWLAGGGEWMQHRSALALFAVCAGALALLLGVLFGPLAGCLCGLLFAAHPAGHEAVCWPCTRADTMVLVAMAGASVAFVRHLRGAAGPNLAAAALGAVVAAGCKETALLLPAWFALLDIATRGRELPLARRLRPHLLLLPVWLAYVAWRWLVLGSPHAGMDPPPESDVAATWFALQVAKLQACFAPAGSRLPALLPYALGALTAWLVAGAIVWRPHRRWLVVASCWLLVSLVPVQWQGTAANLSKSRYVLMPLLALGLVAAAVLGRGATARWFRGAGIALLLGNLVVLATAARSLQAEYAHVWRQMARLREQVAGAAERASDASPLVMLAGLPLYRDIPFLPPTMGWSLAERPLVGADHAFVGLGLSLEPGVGRELLEGEVGPWRALWQHGATLCYWRATDGDGELVLVPPPAAPPAGAAAIELVQASSGFAVRGGVAPPWPIGAVEVTADRPFDGGQLIWRSGAGQVGQLPIGPARAADGGASSTVDLMADGSFLALGVLSGIAGFDVRLQPDGARATSLRVLPPPPPAPLAAPLRGERIALHQLAERLPLASVPAAASPGSTTAVLMTKAFACRVPLERGAPVTLAANARRWLGELDRFAADGLCFYYLECRIDGRTWRSEIDWFRRRRGQ